MAKRSKGKSETQYLYSLRREPEASEHAELVRWAVARSDSITLAAFDARTDPADVLVGPLAPLATQLMSHRATREWPGTRARRDAGLLRFRATPITADVMATAVPRLFGWEELELEDPAFWRGDACWMSTTSHESLAHITATENEMQQMQAELPLLGALVGRRVRLRR